MASRSCCTSTPFMQNISVGGCMPPSASPLRHSTPARKATSPSPVQSMTVLARIASRPALLSMMTPFTSSPSLTTSVQKAYSSTSTPFSSMISSAVRLTSSGSMIVRLMCRAQGRCSLAAPRARSRSMKRCADPSMIWLPLWPKKPRIGRPMVRLPPRKLRLSTSITRRPSPAAASAAMIPAGPPPTTRMSTSARTGMSRAGS